MRKVTIIVTTRNRPDYLFRCLLAIKLQTLEEFECIIVGDNCNYSEAVYREFENDDRFIYYKLCGNKIPNVGAIGKNIGINNSSTDYICYCDDDNILLPNHLEVLYNGIKDSDKELVFSQFYNVDFKNASAFEILDRDLYYTDHTKDIRSTDAIVMMHSKKAAIAVGGWQPKSLVGYNEDGYFIRKIKEKLENDFTQFSLVTAIYYEHWVNMEEKIKEHDEYTKALAELKGVYVYPQLVNELKKKYL